MDSYINNEIHNYIYIYIYIYIQREIQVVGKVVVLFSKMKKCFTVVVSRTRSHYRLTPVILVAVSLICSWSSAGASHSRPTRQNECSKSVFNK